MHRASASNETNKNIQYRTHQSYFYEDKEQCWKLFWAGGAKQRGAERADVSETTLTPYCGSDGTVAKQQHLCRHETFTCSSAIDSAMWQLKGNIEAASQKALLRYASALISVWETGIAFMLSCQFQCPKPCPALKATHPCETNKRPWHVVPIFYKGVLTSHFYKEQKNRICG